MEIVVCEMKGILLVHANSYNTVIVTRYWGFSELSDVSFLVLSVFRRVKVTTLSISLLCS